MGDLSAASVGQISVAVKDLARATTFYRDILGLPYLFSTPAMAFFRCGQVRLLLAAAGESSTALETSILYYAVGDIDETFGTLSARGVTVVSKPHTAGATDTADIWLAFFRDSEENVFALIEERTFTPDRKGM